MPRISPLKKEIQYINKVPYLLKAVYPISRIKDAAGLKKWFGCSHAFKNVKQGVYYFCDKIDDAEIIQITPLSMEYLQ